MEVFRFVSVLHRRSAALVLFFISREAQQFLALVDHELDLLGHVRLSCSPLLGMG